MKFHTHFRLMDGNYHQDPELPWEANLAAAIIRQAMIDAKRLQRRGVDALKDCNKWEIVNFFHGNWCRTLLCLTTKTGKDMLKEIGW